MAIFRIKSKNQAQGFLMRLRRDVRGNTMAMMAAALIPLIAMTGSAIDISRGYMVKVRLQQACDAGALAARKAMDSNSLSAAAKAEGDKLFNFNFADGMFQAMNTSFTPLATADGQVTATATTRVPYTLMKIFGQDYADLTVRCDAKLEISNTDVMMVLDTTGSMADCPDDSNCNSGPGSKIVALRDAVKQFFITVNGSTSGSARFRIGFVPYSSTVNLGDILAPEWIVDNWTYQSRQAVMDTPNLVPLDTSSPNVVERYKVGGVDTKISNGNCTKFGNNTSFGGFAPNPSGTPVYSPSGPPAAPTPYTRTDYTRKNVTYSGTQYCDRDKTVTARTYPQDGFKFTKWIYQPVSYDVSGFKAGNGVKVYTSSASPSGKVNALGTYNMADLVNTPGSTVPYTTTYWNHCAEERETMATSSTPYFDPDSKDMNINETPTPGSPESHWRPLWREVVYDRSTQAPQIGTTTTTPSVPNRSPVTNSWCPAASLKLASLTTSDIQTYVDSLVATGNTYHDLGMAWGLRLMSPSGLFGNENLTAPNGKAIGRHIIFMTDGLMNTPPDTYSSHGYEKWDQRVSGTASPTTANLIARHSARFLALCNAARTENITVWTVAFGTSNPPELLQCANNDPKKSFVATTPAELASKFNEIASQIADLRLSQ